MRRVDQADAVGDLERDLARGRNGRSQAMIGCSSGLTLKVSFQPSSLGPGGYICPSQANPVDELRVEQVDVDRVGIHTVMGDLPDLSPVARAPIGVASIEPLMISTGGLA